MNPDLVRYLSSFPALSPGEVEEIAQHIPVGIFAKGEVLLRDDEVASKCYFVLKGCVRQYILQDGLEKTTAFYTEEQAVVSFTSHTQQIPAGHYLSCVEECVLMIGHLDAEKDMFSKFPKLETITREIMEKDFGKTQEAFATFMTSSPEERYLDLLQHRPGLLQRVPQHQLASYLGITPESLSRIRKRMTDKKFNAQQ